MAEEYSIVCLYLSLFIHSSFDGPWGCLHTLTVVSSTAVNMPEHVFVGEPVFHSLGYISRSGIGRLCGNSIFNFLRRT